MKERVGDFVTKHRVTILTALSYGTMLSRVLPRASRVITVFYLAGQLASFMHENRESLKPRWQQALKRFKRRAH